jgi:DNA replication and repair protein RecF
VTLQRLRLTGFRNLQDGALEFPEEGVAVVGPNAQGKSNLLEAIYYLEIFRSFRGTREDRIVRFGAEHFRVEGRLVGGVEGGEESHRESRPDPGFGEREAPHADLRVDPRAEAPDAPGDTIGDTMGVGIPRVPRPLTVAAAFMKAGRVKKVTVDGQEPPRIADAIGRVGAVLFTPEDVRLVSDGPQERRRFLDILLSINVPGYLDALQRYRQALAQRNAALKEGRGGSSVSAWDPVLVESGARVGWTRARWIREGAPTFRSVYAQVSGEEEASLEYDPSVPVGVEDTEEDVALAFRHVLSEGGEAERRRGTTLSGPHRDEVRMFLHPGTGRERDLREYGSGGQRRTAALALRLLEAETLSSRRRRAPLLLLDDIFAELDDTRSERVMELMERTAVGQVILTAPKESELRFRSDRLPRWTVREGVVA